MPYALHRVHCAVLVVLLGSLPAHAFAAASAHLVYVRGPGAEQCPGEEAVRKAVGARLGYDPFFAWAHDTLFAAITRSASPAPAPAPSPAPPVEVWIEPPATRVPERNPAAQMQVAEIEVRNASGKGNAVW